MNDVYMREGPTRTERRAASNPVVWFEIFHGGKMGREGHEDLSDPSKTAGYASERWGDQQRKGVNIEGRVTFCKYFLM